MEPQSDGLVEAEVRRSGFVDWDASAADGQGMELLLLLLLWLANWCTHLLVPRRLDAPDRPRRANAELLSKTRYRRKAAAPADVERQLRLARTQLES